MKFLKKLFKKKQTQEPVSEKNYQFIEMARNIGIQIDDTVNRIFSEFNAKFINMPITYIVPAVWGQMENGELSQDQKDIHQMIAPLVNGILATMESHKLNDAQNYALGYVLRGLIIYKLAFMMESFKNISQQKQADKNMEFLKNVKPIGFA